MPILRSVDEQVGPPAGRGGGQLLEGTDPQAAVAAASANAAATSYAWGGTVDAAAVDAPAPPPGPTPPATLNDAILALRRRDAAFDPALLAVRSRAIFGAVDQAWLSGNALFSRPYLGNALWEQHRQDIETLDANHQRWEYQGFELHDATLVALHTDAHFDTAAVLFTAYSCNVILDLQDGRRVGGDSEPHSWTEGWVFQRGSTAVTQPSASATQSTCANCGAPLALGADGLCQYCRQSPSPGLTDWLAMRIDVVRVEVHRESLASRAAEWTLRPRAPSQYVALEAFHDDGPQPSLPVHAPVSVVGADAETGLAAIRERDPQLNEHGLVADAREVAERWVQAHNTPDPQLIRPFSDATFWAGQVADIAALSAQGRRHVRGGFEVQDGTVTSVRAGEPADQVTVELQCVSSDVTIDTHTGSALVGDPGASSPWILALTFSRATGCRSDPDGPGVMRRYCFSCRAALDPHAVTAEGRCPACGAGVAADSIDWLLTGATARSS